MIVVLDTRSLVRWTAADADERLHRARLELLLETVVKGRGRIVLPMPVIAELLVRTGPATQDWLSAMSRKSAVVLAPFDMRAALETSMLDAAALNSGNKRGARKKDPWQLVKIDRQVVGIARARQATALITDDAGLTTTAREAGLNVVGLEDLPLPHSAAQRELGLTPPAPARGAVDVRPLPPQAR